MCKKVMFLVVVLGLAAGAQALPVNWTIQHHWELEETSGTTAYDSVGGLHASNSGATINQPGPGDPDFKAYEFGAEEGDVLSTGLIIPSVPVDGDWGVFVTFKTSHDHPTGDQGHLFGWNDGAADNRGALYIYRHNLGFWMRNGPALATGAVDDGKWHTAGVVREGDTWTLYLDGDPKDSANSSAAIPAIGAVIGNGVGYDYDFQGLISDVVYMPEPATVALLGLGSLVLLRRRK